MKPYESVCKIDMSQYHCACSLFHIHLGATRKSMDYIWWDGLVSYLETWIASFKADSSVKEIDEVVMLFSTIICSNRSLPQISADPSLLNASLIL